MTYEHGNTSKTPDAAVYAMAPQVRSAADAARAWLGAGLGSGVSRISQGMNMRVETIGKATLYLADFREILPSLPKVGAVVTDPPYSDEAHSAGRRVLTRGRDLGRSRSVDNAALPFAPLEDGQRKALVEWSATNCAGWFLAFCQAEAVAGWRDEVDSAGARWIRAQIWVKPDSAPQLSGDRPAQGYESIATAWCGTGRSQWNGGGRRGVYTFPKHDPEYGHGGLLNEHPTKKPIALMNELVSLFTTDAGIVCDPFMGSGTTGVACMNMGREFIGVERDPKYFETACRRVKAAQDQLRLFA